MLPVKIVRSLLLGETMKNPPHYHHHENSDDADDEHDHQHHHFNNNPTKKNRKIPMLLFTPTKELITDTFRLASLARDLGMNFHPSPSLSHLIFSWPNQTHAHALHSHSSPSPSSSTSSPFTPTTTTSTSRPSTSSATSSLPNILNDTVPIPFPTLSSPSTSLSLLRFFVSLSKGLFKLVFFNLDNDNTRSDFETNPDHDFHKYRYPFGQIENGGGLLWLHSKVSGRKVRSMDVFAREMAGHGWGMYRTVEKGGNVDGGNGVVYLFRRKEVCRMKFSVGGIIGKGNGNGEECRVRELRLPRLDFEHEVPLRVLLYIVLMADDVFFLE